MSVRLPSLALPLAFALACALGSDPAEHNHSHGDGHSHGADAHGHAEEGQSIARTRFTDTHEMFVELDAPVAGEPYAYHAHVTRLADNRPATDGVLELRWKQDGFTVETWRDEGVSRTGIFADEARAPAAAGDYQLELVYTSGEERASWDLGTVQVGADEPVPHEDEPEGEVAFLKETQWQVPFALALPEERPVATPVALSATVEADPRATAVVPARTGGLVVWSGEALPAVGVTVTEGQVLGYLLPASAAGAFADIQAASRTSRAEVEVAEAEAERVRGLVDEGLLPAKRRLESEAALEAARARQAAAGRQLGEGGGLAIRAPRSGVVTALSAHHGESVEPGAPLLTVGGQEDRLLRGTLLGRDLSSLSDVAWVTVQRSDWSRPRTLEELEGALLTETVVYDPTSGAAPITAVVPGDTGLRLGDLVELTLGVGHGETYLTVPREAVVEVNTRPYVFVMISGESFARRAVRLGPADAEGIAILEGVRPGERVVALGGFDVHVASLGGALESHRH